MADKPKQEHAPEDGSGHGKRTGQSIALLIGCLAISVLLWLLWPRYGIDLVYRQLPLVQPKAPLVAQTGGKVPAWADAAPGQQQAPVQPPPVQDQQQAEQAEPPDMMARYGQTGDLFGGLNTFLTGVAGAAVLWAGFMQYHTMKKTLADSEHERKHRVRQEFESFFFQLLHLSEATTAKLVYTRAGEETRKGSRALDKHAYELHMAVKADNLADPADVLEALVTHFMIDAYDRRPSLFGPHYRLIVQTFEYVARSTLAREDKCRYADIARGQIGEGAVLMLALYGLTAEGQALHPLIEEFNLLEHLHRRYRHAYKEALSLAYRSTAFERTPNKAGTTPMHSPSRSVKLDIRRRVAQHVADDKYEAQRTNSGLGGN